MKSWIPHTVREKCLLLQSLVVLTTIRLALQFVPFQRFKKWSNRCFDSRPKIHSPERVAEVEKAVEAAIFHTPFRATCLHKSLAVKYLLRGDRSVHLLVGVKQTPKKEFAAHAWVEWDGKTLNDEKIQGNYTTLWKWE